MTPYSRVGEQHGRHKLTSEQVKAIRQTYEEGRVSQMHLALDYDVSQGLIWKIVTRRLWAHVA